MNVPNLLTSLRFLMVPFFAAVFFSDHPDRVMLSFGIFVLAGITDVLDGYIARKFNLITTFGIVMDPLADKLMLLTVLSCYAYAGMIPIWILGIMLVKELMMISGGLFLYYCREQHVVPSTKFGKVATVLFYVAIVVLVFYPDQGWVLGTLIAAVLFKLIAFVHYATGFHKLHMSDK